jgi:hypothetical protein
MAATARNFSAGLVITACVVAALPAKSKELTIGEPVRYEGILCSKAADAQALLDHVATNGEGSYFTRPAECRSGTVSFTPEALIAKAEATDTGNTWQVVQVNLIDVQATGYIITALPLFSGQAI